jgi:hypothetical protein
MRDGEVGWARGSEESPCQVVGREDAVRYYKDNRSLPEESF